MRNLASLYTLVALALFFSAGAALAQPPGGFGPPGGSGPPGFSPALPPAFSPYLNLARQGASPAVNYYGIVRPQTQFANSITALQNQVNQVNPFAAAAAAGSEQALTTGHPFGFQNYRYYFQNQNFAGGYGTGIGMGYGTSGLGRPGFGTGGQPGSGPGSQQLGVPPPRHR